MPGIINASMGLDRFHQPCSDARRPSVGAHAGSTTALQQLAAMHQQENTGACEYERQQSECKLCGLSRCLVGRFVNRAVHEARHPRCCDQQHADETGWQSMHQRFPWI